MKGAMSIFRSVWTIKFTTAFRTCCRKYCTDYTTAKKVIHPYSQIHPWKSETEFAQDMLKNVIYNTDGIIAINKPYGIPLINKPNVNLMRIDRSHKIVGEVNYSIQDVLPFLAKELDVPILIPCLGSEKYMSGIYIFGINDNVCKRIKLARDRTLGKYKTYWVVTTRVPNEIKGKHHLAMILKTSALGDKKPVIVNNWSNNAVKRNEVKIMNVNYKILTNSTHNLSSLIEIQSSSRKWNSVRLFVSTMLYSPILGDNVHGSRVQEIMGTWLKVDPFADSCWDMPKLNQQLLDLLDIKRSQQEIIPAHIHLRRVYLLVGKEKKDLIIEAPLRDPFAWTCRQLKFKIPDEEWNSVADNEEKLAYV